MDFSTISPDKIVWLFIIFFVLLIVFAVIRFFWQHVIRYLVHGCVALVAIVALLVLLHYWRVF